MATRAEAEAKLPAPPFLTTIIPTVGREELSRAVLSVLHQETGSACEVIVVNDTGRPLPDADWQADLRVRILDTNRQERSVARNTGAAEARGKFLHFLDDDDWMADGAIEHLSQAAADSEGKLLYGATQLVDREGASLIVLRHDMAGNLACQTMCGEWIPLQSLAVDRELFWRIGAFHPWQAGAEDIDLLRRAAVREDFIFIPEILSCVGMGASGSTTARTRQRPLGRRGRELILDQWDTFRRMRASASAPRWSGGIVRIYLTSLVWNIVRLRLLKALQRALYAGAALIRSGRHLLDSAFWGSVLRNYQSVTFRKGFADSRSKGVNRSGGEPD